jgi:hypothetical protein
LVFPFGLMASHIECHRNGWHLHSNWERLHLGRLYEFCSNELCSTNYVQQIMFHKLCFTNYVRQIIVHFTSDTSALKWL